jgi:hypothetical protein
MSSTLTAWLIRTVIFFVVLGTALFFAYREQIWTVDRIDNRRENADRLHKN